MEVIYAKLNPSKDVSIFQDVSQKTAEGFTACIIKGQIGKFAATRIFNDTKRTGVLEIVTEKEWNDQEAKKKEVASSSEKETSNVKLVDVAIEQGKKIIEDASKKASEIVSSSYSEAEKIKADALKEAEEIKADALAEAEKIKSEAEKIKADASKDPSVKANDTGGQGNVKKTGN